MLILMLVAAAAAVAAVASNDSTRNTLQEPRPSSAGVGRGVAMLRAGTSCYSSERGAATMRTAAKVARDV